MTGTLLVDKLTFLRRRRRENEAVVLAQAMQAGIDALYREALVEAYLLGEVPRQRVLDELGIETVTEIDYQRDTLERDVSWGASGLAGH